MNDERVEDGEFYRRAAAKDLSLTVQELQQRLALTKAIVAT